MKKRNNTLIRQIFAGGLTAALLLSGCGSSGSAPMMEASNGAAATGEAAAYADEYIDYEMADTSDIYGGESDMNGGLAPDVSGAQNTNRKLIRNVSLEVETQDFTTLIANVTNRVKSLGGYVENSNIYNGSNYSGVVQRNASMTLRIPSAQADTFLAEVSNQSNITQQNESVNDVTLAYVDLESHKKVLIAEQENLIEMLEASTKLEDMITLESLISELRYQIESMESQLRTYDNKVDYTTIVLHVTEVKELTPIVEEEPEEEPGAWERISTGFMDNLNAVLTVLGNIAIGIITRIPSLIALAILVLIGVLIYRKVRKAQLKKAKTYTYTASPLFADQPKTAEPVNNNKTEQPVNAEPVKNEKTENAEKKETNIKK